MTPLLSGELAGVHNPRGRADGEGLLRALPGATLVESGPLALACSAPSWVNGICAGVAGRVQQTPTLREELALGPGAPLEHVLATGYARWASGLLHRLRGPFALVVWSSDERRGLLAQDQLGGRSLFTFVDGSRLLFATEVKVLLGLLRRRPDPDELALAYHLVDHSVPDGRMLFKGIRRIGGGRHLELSDAGHVERRHWAPRYEPPLDDSRAELAARLRSGLTNAVEDAVPTDRTAAVLLSGGLDSSIVAGLAARRTPRLQAISAAFPDDPEVDETAWSRQVAAHLGATHTTVPIEGVDPLGLAEAYLRAWALPLPVPGLVIEEPLIAAARGAGAGVVLDGQGGDELFGAAQYLVSDHLRHLRPLSAWRVARRHPWLGSNPPRRHIRQVVTTIGVRGALPPGLHERVRRRRDPERYVPGWLRPEPRRLFRESEDPWRWKRLDGPRWWAWLADTLTRGREKADIADYVRRRGDMGGVEARSPLLDVDLVELVLRMPPETNFDPVTSRPLVREALSGALPAAVLARRDKRDFSAWYHHRLQSAQSMERIQQLLDRRTAMVGAYVDLARLHREHLDRPASVGEADWRQWAIYVWNAVTAEMWLRAQAS